MTIILVGCPDIRGLRYSRDLVYLNNMYLSIRKVSGAGTTKQNGLDQVAAVYLQSFHVDMFADVVQVHGVFLSVGELPGHTAQPGG